MHKLKSVTIEVTAKCNLKCAHCYIADYKELTLACDVIIDLLRSLKKLGCQEVNISGGEPLLYPDLGRIIKEANRLKLNLGILRTNGTLINKLNLSLLKSFKQVAISLDGHIKQLHEELRGINTYYKVINALSLLDEHGFHTAIVTMIRPTNIDKLIEMYEFLSKFETIKVWELGLIRPTGRAKNHIKDYYVEIQNLLQRLNDLISYIARTGGKTKVIMGTLVELLEMKKNTIIPTNLSLPTKFLELSPCGYRSSLYIKPDGSVHYCQLMSEVAPHISFLGNILKEDIKDIWINRYPASKQLKLKLKDLKTCIKCKYISVCGGGCRAFALLYKDDLYAPDPISCKVMKNLEGGANK